MERRWGLSWAREPSCLGQGRAGPRCARPCRRWVSCLGPRPPHDRFRVGAARSSESPSAADTGSVLSCCCCCLTLFFFFFFLMLFSYFWLCCIFMAVRARAFSPVVASRGYSSRGLRASRRGGFPLAEQGSRASRLQ